MWLCAVGWLTSVCLMWPIQEVKVDSGANFPTEECKLNWLPFPAQRQQQSELHTHHYFHRGPVVGCDVVRTGIEPYNEAKPPSAQKAACSPSNLRRGQQHIKKARSGVISCGIKKTSLEWRAYCQPSAWKPLTLAISCHFTFHPDNEGG